MSRLRLALVTAPLLAGAPCHAAAPASPQVFLQGLYAPYAADNNLDTDPMGAEADKILTPSLLALLRKEQDVQPGDGDDLDMDPICACQDYTGFKPEAITILETAASAVKAEVKFNNGGPVTVGYKLVKSGDSWRIDDISDPGMPSLRAWLKADTQK